MQKTLHVIFICKENSKNFTCFYDMLKKHEKVNIAPKLCRKNREIST